MSSQGFALLDRYTFMWPIYVFAAATNYLEFLFLLPML
jgi:hypothetical protein